MEIKGVENMVTVELSESTIKRIEDKLYEGVSLDEQLNDLLDDLDLFEKQFYGETTSNINDKRK